MSHAEFARERPPSYAVPQTADTSLKRAIEPDIKRNHGLSGFHLVTTGRDALWLRIGMIHAAEKTIDIQYYSIQNDVTGKLLLEAILRAADRGVRVRILVDAITLKKTDETWSLLNGHPHIELRVFNPLMPPDHGILGRIFPDLGHMTRRMHNKVFIADNQLAIIGGRNLGDAYFDRSNDFNFRDVDMLSVGPIVARISNSFDSYWNGKEAYPIHTLVFAQQPTQDDIVKLREELKAHWQGMLTQGLLPPHFSLPDQLHGHETSFTWAKAELAADSPNKVDQPAPEAESKPESQLAKLVDNAHSEFLAVSPYFVPGEDGVDWLKSLVDRGIRVRVLTNSLGSTDVVAVHTAYRRYRQALLDDGVELYELKPLPGKRPRPGRFSISSRASLHTKAYVIDRQHIVIGTFNLDPRSIELNTEIALIIHSPDLAEQVARMFDQATSPAISYQVVPPLGWVTEENGHKVRYDSEPNAGFWRTMEVDLYSLLPLEHQL